MPEQVAPEVLLEEIIKNKFLGWLVVKRRIEFIHCGAFFIAQNKKSMLVNKS